MIDVEIQSQAVIAHLQAMPDRIRQSLIRAVTASAIAVQAKTMSNLAGVVLQERTHHLHDSIHYEVDSDEHSVTATVGTNVAYARVHEFGGVIDIPTHYRKMTMAFGRPVATPRDILVSAHKANYPERSFLRTALADQAEAIRERIESAVQQAVKE